MLFIDQKLPQFDLKKKDDRNNQVTKEKFRSLLPKWYACQVEYVYIMLKHVTNQFFKKKR